MSCKANLTIAKLESLAAEQGINGKLVYGAYNNNIIGVQIGQYYTKKIDQRHIFRNPHGIAEGRSQLAELYENKARYMLVEINETGTHFCAEIDLFWKEGKKIYFQAASRQLVLPMKFWLETTKLQPALM